MSELFEEWNRKEEGPMTLADWLDLEETCRQYEELEGQTMDNANFLDRLYALEASL